MVWLLERLGMLRRHALALAIAALLATCGTLLQLGSTLNQFDVAAQDAVVRMRAPESFLAQSAPANPAADPRSFITIVAIDDRTLGELGAYNGGYPRHYYAQLIENLLAAPPRVIALDVGFFEPTADDEILAAALDDARKLPLPTSVILGAVGLASNGQSAAASSSGELSFDHALLPVPVLAARADIGLANVVPDAHGTIRSMPLFARLGGLEQPTLGLAAMAKYLRRPASADARPDPGTLQVAGRSLPVDASTSLRINFFGRPSRPYQQNATFRVVSYVDVLRGRIDPSVWRNGLVMVGALGATGLADDYWTPFSEQADKMSGVEIHADVAATVFSSQFLREVDLPAGVALVWGLLLLVVLLTLNLRLVAACVVVPLLMCAFTAASALALYAGGWLVPLAAPLASSLVCFFTLIAVRVAAERRRLARADALTGLPNRARLVELIRGSLATTHTSALLLLDVDRFKDVNDALGQQAGDELLRDLATRLRQRLPESSAVARLGGDEFGAWLPVSSADSTSATCVQMLAALALPFVVGGREVTLSASAGIALHPADGDSPDMLLRRAELAMYSAKHARSGFAYFAPELDRHSAERLALIGALRRAAERDELILYCQPKVDCQSGVVAGVETLVRWQHPEHGLIQPDRFIGLAEEAGLISLVTRWVLNAALGHIRGWLDTGLEVPAAVNLSAHDFDDPRLASIVAELLERWAVPARLLTVEVTETAVLADPARAMDVLSQLGALGVRASLDDFGTGYSSLSAIQRLPLHEIKIDRSFVRDMALEHRDRVIVRSTIELGHSLGLSVVAEGVEDEATFRLLAELGCDKAQGYLFARPLPIEDFLSWMRGSAMTAAGPR